MNETAATGAVAAGAGAAALSYLGLEPAPMFWAVVGASVGMAFAGATTKGRAAIVFVAVVLCCSVFGSWLAQHYMTGESISRNAFACALAIVFHPLLNGLISSVPIAIAGLLRKFGIGEQP